MAPYAELSSLVLSLLCTLSLALLFFGGESLCKGGVGVARYFSVSPVLIGLTVVAIATSAPELLASLYAVHTGNDAIAVGNIIGSNLANFGLILGITALITPLAIHLQILRRELPILMLVTLIFFAIGLFGAITRIAALGLFILFICYLFYILFFARSRLSSDELAELDLHDKPLSLKFSIFFILLGGVLLHIGADLLIESSVVLAKRFGVTESFIGLSVVAIGTSLPELAASLVAAYRNQADLSVGNLVGSNLFNILFICGTIGLIHPIEIQSHLLTLEFPILIGITALTWIFFYTGRKVSRLEGVLLVLSYICVLTFSYYK